MAWVETFKSDVGRIDPESNDMQENGAFCVGLGLSIGTVLLAN